MTRVLRRLTLLTAVLSLALPVAGAAAMPTPGVNLDGIPTDAQIDQSAALGARYARMFVLWASVEPGAPSGGVHRYDQSILTRYDQIVDRLARHGMRPVFVLTTSPPWASGSSNPHTPPRDPAAFAAFAGDFARRYAGRVAAYEIWNEQDDASFWSTGPDPARYAALLRPAHAAMKAADPSARVLMGPLVGNDYAYLERVYAAGGKGSFDGVSVHTDTACLDRGPDSFYRDPAAGNRLARFTFLAYREVRATMLAHGDDKPVWMSELGWSSTTTRCGRGTWAGQKPAGVGEDGQARYLRQAFHCMASDPWLEAALWFTQRDLGTEDTEMNRYGLLRSDGSRKPAWDAFRTVATQGDTLTGPCGDFSGPQVTIVQPATGQRYTERLPIAARVGDAGGVRRITFLADGKRIRGFAPDGPQPYAMRWFGSRDLSYGPHTITVTAEDANGNVASASVQVVHVRKRARGRATRRTSVRAQVRVAGLDATVSGRVLGKGRGRLKGRVKVVWQWTPEGALSAATRSKVAWQSLHARTRGAKRSFRFHQRLSRAGNWRVRVRYAGRAPYKRSASRWTYFVAR